MKANIHPVWFDNAKFTCSCGNSFVAGSTLESAKLDICNKCHPFFTGQQKFIDTLGQVDKFQKKTEISSTKKVLRDQILQTRALKTEKKKEDKPSLKDLLMQARKNLHS